MLWRYMPFDKFASLITRRALWFSNIEVFAQEDSYEATLPNGNFRHRAWKTISDVPEPERTEILARRYSPRPNVETPEFKLMHEIENRDRRIRSNYAYRRSHFANCWHLAEHESVAMWRMYGETKNSVAIISNAERIRAALANVEEEVYLGAIQYHDYGHATFDLANGFTPIVCKRNDFGYEKEARLVIWRTDLVSKKELFYRPNGPEVVKMPMEVDEIEATDILAGFEVACQPKVLIKEIKLSPICDSWFERLVTDFCGLAKIELSVGSSSLASSPPR